MFDWFLAFNDAILSAEVTQHWKRWEADNEWKGFLDDNSMLARIPLDGLGQSTKLRSELWET